MSAILRNNQLRTAVSKDRPAPARKFSSIGIDMSKASASESANRSSRTNGDHIVGGIGTIASFAALAAQAAAQARLALATPLPAKIDVGGVIRTHATSVVSALGTDVVSMHAASNVKEVVSELTARALPIHKQSVGFVRRLDAPEIDHVTVDVDKLKGTIDSFFVTVVFSVPLSAIEDGSVAGLRMFRATTGNSQASGTLSLYAIERLMPDRPIAKQKNNNFVAEHDKRLTAAGVDTQLSKLTMFDPVRKQRVSAIDGGFDVGVQQLSQTGRIFDASVVERKVGSFLLSGSLINVDQTVAEDLKFLRRVQTYNNVASTVGTTGSIVLVGSGIVHSRGMAPEQARQASFSPSGSVVSSNNVRNFKEIKFVPLGLPGVLPESRARIIGDQIQYTVEDQTVAFGRSYVYQLSLVGKGLQESGRSRTVGVVVDGKRIPPKPTKISAHVQDSGYFYAHGYTAGRTNVILTAFSDDGLVEKFEFYRSFLGTKPAPSGSFSVATVAGAGGHPLTVEAVAVSDNGFVPIGEAFCSFGAGSLRYLSMLPGELSRFRVYAVDVFGNKSEQPAEVDVFVPDAKKQVYIRDPKVTVEVSAEKQLAQLIVDSDDDRIVAFKIRRKDRTIGHRALTAPTQTNVLIGGDRRSARCNNLFDGEVLKAKGGIDSQSAWSGYVQRTGPRVVFVDTDSRIDHTYQYSVVGYDRFGNATNSIGGTVTVTRRQLVNRPVNVTASIALDDSGNLSGVRLFWNDGNIDVTAEDKLGSQNVLSDTSTRTLFQVERLSPGEHIWRQFPLVSFTSGSQLQLFDPLEGTMEVKSFEPQPVRRGNSYLYRIMAVQTGTFYSNFCDPVSVLVDFPPSQPEGFRIVSADPKTRPFHVTLGWSTSTGSGIVDRWEIERAEINNYAASRMNLRNPLSFTGVSFVPFRTVFKESSRQRARTFDVSASLPDTGEHRFLDQSTRFGNTYIYRIRAVGPTGIASSWDDVSAVVVSASMPARSSSLVTSNATRGSLASSVAVTSPVVKGITVADAAHSKKQDALVTQAEKSVLSLSVGPVAVKSNYLSAPIETTTRSFSLLPKETKPEVAAPSKLPVPVRRPLLPARKGR